MPAELMEPLCIVSVFLSQEVTQLITMLMLSSIFPCKNRAAFWVLEMVVFPVIMFTAKLMFQQALVSIGTIVLQFLPVLWFLRGRPTVKGMVFFLAIFLQLIAELPIALVWMLATGEQVMDMGAVEAHYAIYLGVSLMHTLMMIVVFYFYYRICRHMIRRSSIETAHQGERWTNAFAIFPFLQLAFVVGMLWVATLYSGNSVDRVLVCMVVFLGCLGVDALLFVEMRKWFDMQVSKIEAKALQDQVDEYLQAAGELQIVLQEVATIRHDLRNHIQVISSLCDRGQRQEAQAYLQEVTRELDAGQERGEAQGCSMR